MWAGSSAESYTYATKYQLNAEKDTSATINSYVRSAKMPSVETACLYSTPLEATRDLHIRSLPGPHVVNTCVPGFFHFCCCLQPVMVASGFRLITEHYPLRCGKLASNYSVSIYQVTIKIRNLGLTKCIWNHL